MRRVPLSDVAHVLVCCSCGAMTANPSPRYCSECGAMVAEVVDQSDVEEAAMAYAHDVGFDEGYESAMQELEE